ncbi:MAG: hypothetical protein AAF809_05580 [Bacteroidota bacterium]
MPLLARSSLRAAALVASLVLLTTAGCDSTPGVEPIDTATPPRVSNLTVTPGVVQFEDVSADGQTAFFTVNAAVDVTGDATEVRFIVQPQVGFDPIAEVVAANPGSGRVEERLDVELPRDRSGLLSVLAVVVGPDGAGTNEARTTILVERPNAPPVIDRVAAPDTFSPPGVLRFDVTASDPDGPNDLLKVQVITPVGDLLDLFFVREGLYTASFDVPVADPGENPFVFFATDRAGAESARDTFIVTITE